MTCFACSTLRARNAIPRYHAVDKSERSGLSDVELDKSLIDLITSLQHLKEEDRKDILNTLNALVRDAKARSAYAPV